MPINKFNYDKDLSTYDNDIMYMNQTYPPVFYREGACLVRGLETKVLSIESHHHQYNGFVIELCDVCHVSWEKQVTFPRCTCLLTMRNHFEPINMKSIFTALRSDFR